MPPPPPKPPPTPPLTAPRMGPRPLPLFLAMEASSWLMCCAVSQMLKNGWLSSNNNSTSNSNSTNASKTSTSSWNSSTSSSKTSTNSSNNSSPPPPPPPAKDAATTAPRDGASPFPPLPELLLPEPLRSLLREPLNRLLPPLPPEMEPLARPLAAAIEAEACRRFDRFLRGVEVYRQHPYRRNLPPVPEVWRCGTVTLLDYAPQAAAEAPVVLAVPSLVNRSYILDLSPSCSLMRFLAAQGCRPLLLDWGTPQAQDAEQAFSVSEMIFRRLLPAIIAATALTGQPPLLLGYCMGGVMALAAAQLAQAAAIPLAGYVGMATPWDFHADQPPALAALRQTAEATLSGITALGQAPVDLLQILFSSLDLHGVVRKFQAFSALVAREGIESPSVEAFVALEDWVNDGVPLSAAVARECLTDWYGANQPVAGQWAIAGQAIRPTDLSLPALLLIPEKDRIVPPASARALAAQMPEADVLSLPLGHVGMIVGRSAPAMVWQPLADWIHAGRSA